jgi:hypothetical protein
VGRFNILSKAERAVAAYIIDEGAGTSEDVFSSKRFSDVPNPPYTVVVALGGSEVTQGSANYKVKMRIDVVANSAPDKGEDTEDMRSDSDERCSATFDIFHLEDDDQSGGACADAITSAARGSGYNDLQEFTVTDVIRGEMEHGAEGGREGSLWMDTFEITLICAPYDLD